MSEGVSLKKGPRAALGPFGGRRSERAEGRSEPFPPPEGGGRKGLSRAVGERAFFTTLVPLPPLPSPEPTCAPSPVFPADGAVLDGPPVFRWASDCAGVVLELSTDPRFLLESTFTFGAVTGSRFTFGSTLWVGIDQRFAAGGWWRVVGGATDGEHPSEARKFALP